MSNTLDSQVTALLARMDALVELLQDRGVGPDRIIRDGPALFELTGLKRTQRDDLIEQGLFPAPVKLSERAKGWFAREIEKWQRDRQAKRDGAKRD